MTADDAHDPAGIDHDAAIVALAGGNAALYAACRTAIGTLEGAASERDQVGVAIIVSQLARLARHAQGEDTSQELNRLFGAVADNVGFSQFPWPAWSCTACGCLFTPEGNADDEEIFVDRSALIGSSGGPCPEDCACHDLPYNVGKDPG